MFFVFIPIIDTRGTSVFECPGDFLDFMPKQDDLSAGSDKNHAGDSIWWVTDLADFHLSERFW